MESTVAQTVLNPSRLSHGRLILLIKTLLCDRIGGVIKFPSQGKIPCFPYITVTRHRIERDGWQRSEEYSEEDSAMKYQTDVYFTYRVKCQGYESENILLDLQQMFLRSDVKDLFRDLLGGNLIYTTDILPAYGEINEEFIEIASFDIRIGYVDTTLQTALECSVADLAPLLGSYPITTVTGEGELYEHLDDQDPLLVEFNASVAST
jgi:hypothetical protein